MEIITKYLAYDGKEFDDEWDCVEYEEKLNILNFRKDGGFMLDEKFTPVELFEDAVYLNIPTEKCYHYLSKMAEENGVYFSIQSHERGFYVLNNENEFDNIEGKIEYYQNILNALKQYQEDTKQQAEKAEQTW